MPDTVGLPAEPRAALQVERLRSLVRRLTTCGNTFWSERLSEVDPSSVTTLQDLPSLPFTVKADLRDTYPLGMVTTPLTDTTRLHASSGTSGKPTIVVYTPHDLAVWAEVNARSLALAGTRPDDILHNGYGYGLFTGGLGLHYGGERLGCTVVPVSGGNTALQLQLLRDLGSRVMSATPSFSLLLAERAREQEILGDLNVEIGILGAEPWSEGMRTRIQDAWGGGFTALDIYGLSEVIGPGVAMEAPDDLGALNVFDDHFLPEVVDPESGEVVPDGEWGELVLTTLTKQAMPVLRYRTGDITRILPDPGPPDRHWTRIARLTGRSDDMLVVRGINVYPRQIETVLMDDPDVGANYAIVVDRRGPMVELRVRAELGDTTAEIPEVTDRLQKVLMDRLRVRTPVELVPPGSMPRTEAGKVKRVFEQVDDTDPLG
ncbi:MAG: phenylacetate--CoA ligase [Actinobacteria bacterium]|jgi:phenylacetate-CoA ligase|nr:phenylacetate--CoA ligase [Actinomycetota bacterium]MBT3687904.1 phenylacetate--CoA ligase [Actinomycetota bacterium]MBT4036627.1 phenylacetate--CoA ligase [Actinomycetota bacterium]MBT4278634.1 phenylacetate--CoA ligase [Actinomycetota bacterium]MBT4342476.1 phenylacetate--CoA ligase [Actinomycetota bacterium]